MVTLFKKSLPLFLFFSFSLLYISRLTRDIFGGDVGDLVTAGCVGGIPHPSGYPLFSLLTFFLCKLHGTFSLPAVFWVGLISVFAASFSLVLFYLLSQRIIKQILPSLFATLTLGFSYLFWLYAEIPEVFMLNVFFALLLFFLCILYREKQNIRYLFLFCFSFGLALTNHHTIVLLLPSYFILLWPLVKKEKKKIQTFLIGGICSMLGFSVYLYVFWATRNASPILWERVTDIQSFLTLLLRKRYGTLSAGGFGVPELAELFVILKTYFVTLISQLSIIGSILALIGVDQVIKKDKQLALSYGVGFILAGPFFMGYAGFPLSSAFHIGVSERFILLSTVLLALFLPFGYEGLLNGVKRLLRTKSLLPLFIVVLFFIPLFLFILNSKKTDLSSLNYGDRLGKNILTPLPQNAVVLLWGDTSLFNTWYVHYVLGVRKDITILNIVDIQTSDLFNKAYEKIDKKHPKDSTAKKTASTLLSLDTSTPVFSFTSEISPEGLFSWVPYGLVYELRREEEGEVSFEEFTTRTNTVWEKIYLPDIRYTKNQTARSLTIADIPVTYANALTMHGKYISTVYNDAKEAQRLYKKALLVDPTYAEAHASLGVSLANANVCDQAEKSLLQAQRLVPYNKTYYLQLGSLYQTCLKDPEKLETLSRMYTSTFRSELVTDIQREEQKRGKQ